MEVECEILFEKKAKKTTFLRALEGFHELENKMIHSCEKLCHSDAWIAGIDESGRGPVRPMVYSVAYCPRSYEHQLKKYGFSDSKTLTPEKREHLMQALLTSKELKENVGWFTCIISAREISQKMLQVNGSYNLNAQAHNTTIQLLHEVFQLCPNIKEIYVDSVDIQKNDISKVHVEWHNKNEISNMYPIKSYFKVPKIKQENIGFSMYGQNVELDDF
ncbi:hypothetical protein PCK2_000568 [Pneumocystis canis]|nr:hypothetical protein PCK2_000568 [Pneumocystis canis]